MSKQLFLNVEQVLDTIFSELPNGVYADDRADDPDTTKRSVSSSELRAHAQVFANLYANLKNINSDKFITTVTQEGLASWEKELFASVQDSMQSLETRRGNLLSKLRSNIGISLPAIRDVVAGILDPLGIPFQLVPYSGQYNGNITGAWVLGDSPLGLSTYLSFLDPLYGAQQDQTPLDCDLDYAAAGLTLQQLEMIQLTAYAYELQIYGNASAETLALIEKRLTEQEPARSDHIIRNNATPPNTEPDQMTEEWNTDYIWRWVS